MPNKIVIESVTLTKDAYDSLLKSALWADALDDAGVDNWQGVEFAIETYKELLHAAGFNDE